MERVLFHRPLGVLVAVVPIVATLTAASVLTPTVTNDVWAQAQPPTTISPVQTPPPVPGVDYTVAEPGNAGSTEGGVTPATPVPPVFSSDPMTGVGVPEDGGSLATNLGGSDIVVSSVGGSHQVDGPKRRGDRVPRVTPRP